MLDEYFKLPKERQWIDPHHIAGHDTNFSQVMEEIAVQLILRYGSEAQIPRDLHAAVVQLFVKLKQSEKELQAIILRVAREGMTD